MSQDISTFYQVAQERDFARDYMLRVRQMGPTTFTETDFIYIQTATLPSKSISNQKVPYMGLDFNVPGTVKYDASDAWDIKVLADSQGLIRTNLEAWMTTIFDDSSSQGNLAVPGVDQLVQLDLVDDQLNVLNTYKLYGVYVVKLGTIAYDIQGTGAPLSYTATLAYQYWEHTTVATGTTTTS